MPAPQKNILVVEDDEMVQAFLALHLETEGYGGLCHVNQEKHMSDWRRPAMPAG